METKIVATIVGRQYVYARDVERDYFDTRWSFAFEIDSGMIRGRRYHINGGRDRILLDLEDAKIIADLCAMLTNNGIEPERWHITDYFAIRAGFESWDAAFNARAVVENSH